MPWTANPLRAGSIPAPASKSSQTRLRVRTKFLLCTLILAIMFSGRAEAEETSSPKIFYPFSFVKRLFHPANSSVNPTLSPSPSSANSTAVAAPVPPAPLLQPPNVPTANIGTSIPQATLSAPNKRVDVAEAIRVPISNPKPVARPVKAATVATRFSPSSSKNLKQALWLQAASFGDEAEAISTYDQLTRKYAIFSGLRMRIITSFATEEDDGGVSLRIGPVNQSNAASLCELLNQGKKHPCTLVRDFGKSSTLNLQPGSYDTFVKPENRKNPTATKAGRYWLQLGTFDSEQTAEAEKRELLSAYRSLLSSLSFAISTPRAGSNASAAFRLRTGAFPTTEAAASLCEKLADHAVSCIVVRE